jgi:sRNA-binding regulator protein Hfq
VYCIIQIQIFTANGLLTSGQVAYRDQYGTLILTGYTYFSNGTLIYQINPSTGVLGVVAALCGR